MNRHLLAITVGVDSSPGGVAAVRWGAEQAYLRRVPLHLVSAYHWSLSGARALTEDRGLTDILHRAAVGTLARARDRVRVAWPDLLVTDQAIEGHPAEVLIAQTAASQCVVLGSPRVAAHGRGIGPVAAAVVAHARGPVVVVPAAWQPVAGGAVVVGLGPHRPSSAVLEFAFQTARVSQRPMRLVVCRQFERGAPDDQDGAADAFDAALPDAVTDEVLSFTHRYPDVAVYREVLVGRPASALTWAAEHEHLLVVGRHHDRGPLRRLFGSTTTAALERAACPVAVVADAELVDEPQRAEDAVPARDFWAADYGLSTALTANEELSANGGFSPN